MQTLRDYQIQAINMLRGAMIHHKRTILCVPTGGGKTTIVSEMIRKATEKGKSILFLAHRKELLNQAVERLQQFGLSAGLIQGTNTRILPTLNVASVQTLRNSPCMVAPDIIFVDECHLSMANSYMKIFEAHPNAYVIGMTATPERLDGKPLGAVYSHIANPISIVDLTEQNYLVPMRAFGAKESADLDNIGNVGGDYDNKELYRRFDKPKLYAGVVDNYKKFANNRTFICFCVNVEHSQKMALEFQRNGINCQHVDGTTPQAERDVIIAKFKNKLIQGITNVNLFTEGFDMPHVSCVILNRATQSLALYLQMVGRGLRTAPNKIDLVTIDHGENIIRHGWHDIERDWSLEGRKKKKKKDKQDAMGVRLCSSCQYMMPTGTIVCPNCGHEKIRNQEAPVEAEFAELKRIPVPKELRKPWRTMTEGELRAFAQHKGYKEGWVRVQMKLRDKK